MSGEFGYGFCRPDGAPADKSQDVFVHGRALERSGITNLVKGARIEFQKVPSRRKAGAFEADKIKLLPDATPQAATTAGAQCPQCDQLHGRHAYGCALDEAA
jgi:cold shock CspA family protein